MGLVARKPVFGGGGGVGVGGGGEQHRHRPSFAPVQSGQRLC